MGLSQAGIRHYGLRVRDRRLLRDRDADDSSAMVGDRPAYAGADDRWQEYLHRRGNAGRDRDATRDLSALGAGTAASARGTGKGCERAAQLSVAPEASAL